MSAATIPLHAVRLVLHDHHLRSGRRVLNMPMAATSDPCRVLLSWAPFLPFRPNARKRACVNV